MPPRLPKLSGLSLAEKEEYLKLQEEGYEVDDMLEGEEGEMEGHGEEAHKEEVPKPTPKKAMAKKAKVQKPLEVPKVPRVKAKAMKKKKNTTVALLEALLDRLGKMGGGPQHEPKPPSSNQNVRVPTPAMFNGKRGSFQFFASKVESYALISNIAKEKWVAVALQCMDERPTKVWGTFVKRKEREGVVSSSITWEAFKEFMGKRYDSTDSVAQARQKLDHVYQGNESAEKYIERFVTLLGDIETDYEMSEHDKIHLFLKGLNTPIRLACAINPQTGVRFTDLEALCSYVVQYESNLKAGGMLRGQEGKKLLGSIRAPPQYGRQAKPPATPKPVTGAAAKVDSRTSVPADRQCFFCKAWGHEQWQCQAKRDYLARKARQGLPPPPPRPGTGGQWKDRKQVHWKDNSGHGGNK